MLVQAALKFSIVVCAAIGLFGPANADQVDYTYDDLGRLKTVTYEDGTSVVYNYDPVGNRTTQTVSLGGDNPINDSIPTQGVGNNLLDLANWPVGNAPSTTPALPGWATSTSYTNETRWLRVAGPGSSGQVTTLESGQTESDSNGGGFNPSNTFTIDPTKAYEYSIYFRKHDLSLQNLYLGMTTGGAVKHSINEAVYTNPYFLAWNTTNQQSYLNAGTWYKIVGYVLPEGYPTVSSYADWGGVYEVSTGNRVADTVSFRWSEDRTTNSMYARFFTYYDEVQQNVFTTHFYQPEVRVTNVSYVPVVPALSLTHVSANEGDNISFNVNLSAVTTVDISVDYIIDHPGGANSASSNDYTASSGTLVITKGNTQGTISVPTIEESVAEVDEFVRITLSVPVRATLSDTSRLAYIYDDDSSASFSVNDVSVAEGGALSFTVTKTGSTANSHNVSYATANGTAGSGDFTSASGTLSFSPTQTTQSVTVASLQDSNYENAETVFLNISSATNGATISDAQGIGTINNDDVAPAFTIGNAVELEGNNLSFTVTKVGATTLTHGVSYATANGTAAAGSDYTSKSGTLSFTSAQSSQTIVITGIEDSVYEDNETVLVNLSAATNGATISDSQGVGTISNDDAAPAFSINDITAEEGNNLTFTISKSGSTSKSHSINYATANGTAAAGSDYTTKSGTLTFTAAQSSQTVTITGIEDTTPESNETFNINLSSATAGATISDSQGVGTITNDDVANSPPNAVADSDQTSLYEDVWIYVLNNDSDPDSDPLTITAVTQPSNGTASIATLPPGTIRFFGTSTGSSNFTYTISDGNGGTDTATVFVTVDGGGGGPPF
jgi:YD repeat-containing protein